MKHEQEHECPACREADKLGMNEEQSELFHKLVDAELEVSNAMHDLEEAGVDNDQGVEDALMSAITSIFAEQEQRTLN